MKKPPSMWNPWTSRQRKKIRQKDWKHTDWDVYLTHYLMRHRADGHVFLIPLQQGKPTGKPVADLPPKDGWRFFQALERKFS